MLLFSCLTRSSRSCSCSCSSFHVLPALHAQLLHFFIYPSVLLLPHLIKFLSGHYLVFRSSDFPPVFPPVLPPVLSSLIFSYFLLFSLIFSYFLLFSPVLSSLIFSYFSFYILCPSSFKLCDYSVPCGLEQTRIET